VAGDVEPAAVFAMAERYFGDWKPHAGTRRVVPTVPEAESGPMRVSGAGRGSPELTVAYRLPRAGQETDVEAQLLAMHLGDEEGALKKRLVDDRGIATGVRVRFDGMLYGSVFYITVTMKEGHAPEEAEKDVLEAVQGLLSTPLPEARMVTLRRRYRARVLGAVKSDMRLGFTFLRNALTGSWKNIERNLVRSRTVPADALHAFAAKYFKATNRVVGVCTTKAPPAATPARGRPDHWTDLEFPRKPLTVPSAGPHVRRLDNGVTVVAVPDPLDPVFRVEAILRGGSAEDAPGREGTAAVLAGMLGLSGTPDMSREQVREKLSEIVGTWSVSADRFSLRFVIDTFPRDREQALDLLHDLLMNAVPDPEAAAVEKERMKSRLRNGDARPGTLSNRAFRELLLPADVRTRRATPMSIDAIDTAELEKTLARHRDPRRLILVVSGPFDPSLADRLAKTFGAWEPGTGPVPEIPATADSKPANGLHVMDFDSSQGYVLIGARTRPATDADYPALWTLRAVLSRRIFNHIRSNEGLAYHASARLARHWAVPSLFSVVFQTKNRSVPFGISVALEEIEKIARTGPTAEELATARQAHRAGMERTLGRSGSRAGAFAELVLHEGAGLDWYPRFRSAIEKMTANQVRAAAAEFLEREDLVIVCVGKRAAMAAGDGEHPPRLADFGPVRELAPPARDTRAETPSAVVLAVIRALSQGDTEALAPLVAGELAKRLEDPVAERQIARQGAMLSRAVYEVEYVVTEGDDATVAVEFEMTRGEQEMRVVMEFRLTRVEGGWRCVGFRPKGM